MIVHLRSQGNQKEFDSFLNELIRSEMNNSNTFRYFRRRSLSVLDNHLITVLIKDDVEVAAYGHIDVENNINWLGIYTAEKFRGRGFGRIVMNQLISRSAELGLRRIRLSVDKDNHQAIKLYKSLGFKIHSNLQKCDFYQLEL